VTDSPAARTGGATAPLGDEARHTLRLLGEEFFTVQNTAAPLSATQLGIPGYDALVPDPSRDGARSAAARFASVHQRLAAIDDDLLDEAGRTDKAVLGPLAWAAGAELEHGLWEANASAEAYSSPHSMVFLCVPSAVVNTAAAASDYLARLDGLPGYFTAIAQRYREALADGRLSTQVGARQAVEQLRGHLALSLESDTLATPHLGAGFRAGDFPVRAARAVADKVRPAMALLASVLEEEVAPPGRGDDEVGIGHVPGGEEGYRAAVRAHTTTAMTPEEVHEVGLACVAELEREWSGLAQRALGVSDIAEVHRRLREDRSLRFESSAQIVAVVEAALRRAEEARPLWFPAYRTAPCVVEEINPVEAGNAALAHYRPPAADGSRPGAHCVLTTGPGERFVYEYEALAFHESTPGHHLQIASAQALSQLPDYRRFVDAQLCAYVEGWGLYCERLADEMGLYTSDVARLGMLSFDSLRACRLVVDTGMHHFGWSRRRAVQYMWDNTATTAANISNEVNRYIGWPGQALAYMVGRREICRIRDRAEQRLGAAFDIRGFHGAVLGSGPVPLGVLEDLVDRWVAGAA
jgi:uncharacterized protein (DUF885 family)